MNPEQMLFEHSILIPPIDLFEVSGTHEEVVKRLISRWKELGLRAGIGEKDIFSLLAQLLESVSTSGGIIFYGSAIYCLEGEISDVDIIRTTVWGTPLFENRTNFPLHNVEHDIRKTLAAYVPWFGFLNTLIVFAGENREFLLQNIANAKNLALQNYQLEDQKTIEEVITLSLIKIIEKKEHNIKRRLDVLEAELGEGGRELKPSELIYNVMNYAVRLSEQEFREMTFQALKRIRIKEERRTELTNRFVERVAKLRTRC